MLVCASLRLVQTGGFYAGSVKPWRCPKIGGPPKISQDYVFTLVFLSVNPKHDTQQERAHFLSVAIVGGFMGGLNNVPMLIVGIEFERSWTPGVDRRDSE